MKHHFLWLCALPSLLMGGVAATAIADDGKIAPWAFTCVHEMDRLPALNSQADQLYRYARFLEYDNPKQGFNKDETDKAMNLARYYRIAAAHGHYMASISLIDLLWRVSDNMYDGVATPWRDQREAETERLIADLVARRIPVGFLRRGGFAAQSWDLKETFSNYRQAADLGNAVAQFKAAELLDNDTTIGAAARISVPDKKKLMMDLYHCSAKQEGGEALFSLGEHAMAAGELVQAAAYFQQAVVAGEASGAAAMMGFFEKPESRVSLRKRPWQPDAERVRRYEVLRVFLIDNQYARTRVQNLDQIVPLPPAPLPAWDGEIRWTGETRESFAVGKPSEELLARLAKAKGLDPQTGLPKH